MKRHRLLALFLPTAALVLAVTASRTQDVGAQALARGDAVSVPRPLPDLDRELAERLVTLEASAEVRVEPSSWRMTFAVVGESEEAVACHEVCERRVGELREAFAAAGISMETFHEDFIALQPLYKWEIETREGQELAIERPAGFRVQVNVLLQVPDEPTVWKARRVAARVGVTDILAVDAWNGDLDAQRVAARAKALEALQAKRKTFEEGLFGTTLRVVNVQERTDVHLPADLYRAFQIASTQAFEVPWNRNLARLHAARPRSVLYQGMTPTVDVQDAGQPLRPQISVVATVRVHFAAPR
ncbi:MAG: SIMPL domain-containing protein [Planctomycetes bacterium]|nr:SIMPL domain-containing protein [Planctomycetota bacterium]